MKKFAAKTGLFLFACVIAMPLGAGDATTALFERLDKGGCVPSALTGAIWTITTSPVGTHGALNWGDQLVFEQAQSATLFGSLRTYDLQGTFTVWKNGFPWKSASGWNGACVRNGDLGLYVVTGKVELDGCLHGIAFGRLDHDDGLGDRIEVIFEHAEDNSVCEGDHADAMRHPGHAHGDHN